MAKEKRALNKETLAIYWRHARAYKGLVGLSIASMGLMIGCDIGFPILFKHLFDILATTEANKSGVNIDEIYRLLIPIGILTTLSWLGWQIGLSCLNRFESRTMRDLANTCFAYVHGHSARFFSDTFGGALVTRTSRFVNAFEQIADQFILHLGQTVLKVILIIGVLFWYNLVLGSIFLAWTIILALFNFYFTKYKMKFDLHKAEMDTRVTARVADTVTNALNLKLFASGSRETEDFHSLTEEHRAARFKVWSLGLIYDGAQGVAIRGLDIGLLIIALGYWYAGELTIGDLMMLRSYFFQLADQVRNLGKNVRVIYESFANANEMTGILITPHEIADNEEAISLQVSDGEIEFRNIKFSYATDSKPIFSDFNLTLKPGERVGMVGPSGKGKSTVLKILTRLYDVQGGAVLIDGQNISTVTQESLHRNIAFVPQDPVLFHRSLMENIRYSRPSATDEEVIRAAKLAHCHEFISTFPQGYDTLVGERGVKLSGGERQRVAIARAILMDAPILVLDEATSSLDSESEAFIQDSLSKIMGGKTVIAVAHRLSTIKKMDRIVVIDDGRIVEDGKHDILLEAENGHYQKLWNLQTEAV